MNPEKAGQLKSAASEQDMKRKAAEIHGLETFLKKMDLLVRHCFSLSQFICLNMSCVHITCCHKSQFLVFHC